MTNLKPFATDEYFEYWLHAGEVYRNQIGNRGPINIGQRFEVLATYNAEVARGIVHTDEWKQQMAELQGQYNRIFYGMQAAKPSWGPER